jgi:hypothetical protein
MKICPLLPHSELLASNYWGNRFAQEVGEVTICSKKSTPSYVSSIKSNQFSTVTCHQCTRHRQLAHSRILGGGPMFCSCGSMEYMFGVARASKLGLAMAKHSTSISHYSPTGQCRGSTTTCLFVSRGSWWMLRHGLDA